MFVFSFGFIMGPERYIVLYRVFIGFRSSAVQGFTVSFVGPGTTMLEYRASDWLEIHTYIH